MNSGEQETGTGNEGGEPAARPALFRVPGPPPPSAFQNLVYLNFRLAFWCCRIVGALALIYLGLHLKVLLRDFRPQVVRTSPFSAACYLWFVMELMWRSTFREERHRMFAFYMGIASFICLGIWLVGSILTKAGLFGLPASLPNIFFCYVGFSHFAFAAFGNDYH